MVVAKFGGTSVSTASRIQTICSIVKKEINNKPIVVVSALAGVTNLLLSLTNVSENQRKRVFREIFKLHKLLIEDFFKKKDIQQTLISYVDENLKEVEKLSKTGNLDKEKLDLIASFGEIISSRIVATALETYNIPAKQVLATDLIVTNNNFGMAEFLPSSTRKNVRKILLPMLKTQTVPVITGFIGRTKDGKTTTLGRGGSDYTASIIGFCLAAHEIQIWTDVDGILTADPKIVKNAKTVEVISYKEASELAVLGARVLHPKAILPAVKRNIPVKILNTFNPTHKGTTILPKITKKNWVTSIACKKGIKILDIYAPKMFLMHGFLHKVFKIFDELEISVDFISTSEVNISITMDGKYEIRKLVEELSKFADVEIKNNRATVSVVGRPSGVAPIMPGKAYTRLEKERIDIEMISAGASKINETVVVKQEDADNVVRILHKTFFE